MAKAASGTKARRKKLVIVESPSKAKTIGKFLGSGYKVVASVGHVRDLPKSKLGIEIENDFEAYQEDISQETSEEHQEEISEETFEEYQEDISEETFEDYQENDSEEIEEPITLFELRSVPNDMIRVLHNLMEQTDGIYTAYLKGIKQGDSTGYLVIVDFKGDTSVLDDMAEQVYPYTQGASIEFILLDSDLGQQAAQSTYPFYQKI